ncbi:TIGR03013 family XrtA/PEP-CTERM system glycosyltransferase [Aquabacterium sp. A3]|uniref:TIGR03013 family XrtA/PEP-CTERM system glycosyltransferase n=1 Tax=Aquabacterium sp. A3 TaxID=3132829 RepID=UPI00311A4EA7
MIKIFGHHFHKRSIFQVLFEAAVLMAAAFFAVWLQASMRQPDSVLDSTLTGVFVTVTFIMVNGTLGLYENARSYTRTAMRIRALVAWLASALITLAFLLLMPKVIDKSVWLVFGVLMAAKTLVVLQREVMESFLPSRMTRSRVLIYGVGTRAKAVAESLLRFDPNVDIVGFVESPNEKDRVIDSHPVYGPGQHLSTLVNELQVDEIIVALTERRGGSMPMRELLDCKLDGISVIDIATHFERKVGQIRLDAMSAGYLIFGEGFDQGVVRTVLKRVVDLTGAIFLLLLTLPVMLITALLIKLDSRGAIFYTQDRVGLGGKEFKVVKFRSMRTDAEKDGVPKWATAGDSRVTRVGRVIRKCRIDELPQLFSVLKGDMSLVGPRPERQFFVDQLTQQIPFYAVRHSIKPGVTGWAQVRYQYGSTLEDSVQKLQYDLYYVKNHSLFLDLVVLFETVGVVLTGKGAQ